MVGFQGRPTRRNCLIWTAFFVYLSSEEVHITGKCLNSHPSKETINLDNIIRSGDVCVWSGDRGQLCRIGTQLKAETESSLRNVAFEIEDRTMDNVQNCDSYINIPSSQTYR
jgi:hypothetical protein